MWSLLSGWLPSRVPSRTDLPLLNTLPSAGDSHTLSSPGRWALACPTSWMRKRGSQRARKQTQAHPLPRAHVPRSSRYVLGGKGSLDFTCHPGIGSPVPGLQGPSEGRRCFAQINAWITKKILRQITHQRRAKDLKRYFAKRDTQVAQKHKKTSGRHHFIPARMATSRKSDNKRSVRMWGNRNRHMWLGRI